MRSVGFYRAPAAAGGPWSPSPHWATLETPDCVTSSPEPEQY